jgi:hypothetical protein
MLGDLADAAGVPPGVLNVVTHGQRGGARSRATWTSNAWRSPARDDPRRSTATRPHLTPVSFELGGKSPFVVFDDATSRRRPEDRGLSVRQLGQVGCAATAAARAGVAARRVHGGVRDRVDQIKVRRPREPTHLRPLIHPVALERVRGHVDRALRGGRDAGVRRTSRATACTPTDAVHRLPGRPRSSATRSSGPVLTLQTVRERRRRRAPAIARTSAWRRRSTPARRSAPARVSAAVRGRNRVGSTASTSEICRRRSAAAGSRASGARAGALVRLLLRRQDRCASGRRSTTGAGVIGFCTT